VASLKLKTPYPAVAAINPELDRVDFAVDV
jgi:hypothetical protein